MIKCIIKLGKQQVKNINYCSSEFDQSMIKYIIKTGKATNEKDWPLLISLKGEKQEIIFIPEFE